MNSAFPEQKLDMSVIDYKCVNSVDVEKSNSEPAMIAEIDVSNLKLLVKDERFEGRPSLHLCFSTFSNENCESLSKVCHLLSKFCHHSLTNKIKPYQPNPTNEKCLP